jgi:hypothetical protein
LKVELRMTLKHDAVVTGPGGVVVCEPLRSGGPAVSDLAPALERKPRPTRVSSIAAVTVVRGPAFCRRAIKTRHLRGGGLDSGGWFRLVWHGSSNRNRNRKRCRDRDRCRHVGLGEGEDHTQRRESADCSANCRPVAHRRPAFSPPCRLGLVKSWGPGNVPKRIFPHSDICKPICPSTGCTSCWHDTPTKALPGAVETWTSKMGGRHKRPARKRPGQPPACLPGCLPDQVYLPGGGVSTCTLTLRADRWHLRRDHQVRCTDNAARDRLTGSGSVSAQVSGAAFMLASMLRFRITCGMWCKAAADA